MCDINILYIELYKNIIVFKIFEFILSSLKIFPFLITPIFPGSFNEILLGNRDRFKDREENKITTILLYIFLILSKISLLFLIIFYLFFTNVDHLVL